jgi:hypothetical protein
MICPCICNPVRDCSDLCIGQGAPVHELFSPVWDGQWENQPPTQTWLHFLENIDFYFPNVSKEQKQAFCRDFVVIKIRQMVVEMWLQEYDCCRLGHNHGQSLARTQSARNSVFPCIGFIDNKQEISNDKHNVGRQQPQHGNAEWKQQPRCCHHCICWISKTFNGKSWEQVLQ